MYCPRSSLPSQQRGAALVLALLIFAVSAALIVAMRADFDRVYQQAGGLFIAEQSRAYLRGAEGLATLALLIDYDADKNSDPPRDTLDDFWAQATVPYVLDEGWLSGSLEDLQGRFNLNILAVEEPAAESEVRFTPEQAQFVRLLLAVSDPQLSEAEALSIARAVGDWIDADQTPRPDGAEDDTYLNRDPAYRAANRPLQAVSELRAIEGITAELYAALEPWVTVWPQQQATLNIHTAPATVLRSLGLDNSLQPLDQDVAQALVEMRCEEPFASVDDFLQRSPLAGEEEALLVGLKKQLGEQSDYFLLHAQAEVAGRQRRLYSVLHRQNRQVSILSRTTDARVTPQITERKDPCVR